MEGLVFRGPRELEHRTDLADPAPLASSDAVVRVRLAGLCGSDLHPYLGRERVRLGTIPGHEVVGDVVAEGADVRTVSAGDRVLVPFTTSCGACATCSRGLTARCARGQLFGFGDPDDLDAPVLHGGQAAMLRVPLADTTLVAVPAGLDDHLALLLTDNLPTAWEAVRRADPTSGSPLAVVGLGAVGLCAVAAARAAGADPVVGIDPVDGRRALAERLGADHVATPEDALGLVERAGLEVGSVVEAAGAPAGQRLAFDLLRPGGVLSIIAVQTDASFAFSPVDAYDRNLTVRAGRASARATVPTVLDALTTGVLDRGVTDVLTHVGVPLGDGPQLYRRFAEREAGLIKAAFAPSG